MWGRAPDLVAILTEAGGILILFYREEVEYVFIYYLFGGVQCLILDDS